MLTPVPPLWQPYWFYIRQSCPHCKKASYNSKCNNYFVLFSLQSHISRKYNRKQPKVIYKFCNTACHEITNYKIFWIAIGIMWRFQAKGITCWLGIVAFVTVLNQNQRGPISKNVTLFICKCKWIMAMSRLFF